MNVVQHVNIYDAMRKRVMQIEDDKDDTCRMLPLTARQQLNTEACTSVTDAISLLLSVAHVMAADWQSAMLYLQRVHSVDFHPFCSYLKGNYAVIFNSFF